MNPNCLIPDETTMDDKFFAFHIQVLPKTDETPVINIPQKVKETNLSGIIFNTQEKRTINWGVISLNLLMIQ